MPNIQIQKAGAESASQSDQALPASDLERWAESKPDSSDLSRDLSDELNCRNA
jgi:hypothetical protein